MPRPDESLTRGQAQSMHCRVMTGFGAAVLLGSLGLLLHGGPPTPNGAKPVFERDVLPILRDHCWKCHGDKVRKSGLDLRTLSSALKGGASGEAAVVPGKADASPMFELLSSGKMPPKGQVRPSAAQVATIRKWIDAGAAGEQPAQPVAAPHQELARQVFFLFEVKCQQCHGRKEQK